MSTCFYCQGLSIPKHEICHKCMGNPFITEKYRKYLAQKGNTPLFLETFHNLQFKNLPNINTVRSWDYLIKYHRHYEDDNTITRLRIKKIMEMIPPNRNINIFDIGFGYGHILLELARRGYQHLGGLDISQEAVKYLKREIPNGNFIMGGVTNVPLDSDSVDLVIASEIMEHISPSDTLAVYDEIKRITRKGGVIIFSVPLNDNLETTTFICPHGQLVNPSGHVREYTTDVLDLELAISRLNPVRKCLLIPPSNVGLKPLRIVMGIINRNQPSNYICLYKCP